MKTTTILVTISGEARNVEALTGQYRDQIETKQIATYCVENGLATITSLTPTIAIRLAIPLPLVVSVEDKGSGVIREIEYDADTHQVRRTICPSTDWANRRMQQAAPTIEQTLMADYIGLL